MNHDTKVALGFAGAGIGLVGATVVLLRVMGAKKKVGPPSPNETSNPPVYKVGYFETDLGGGWKLLDAREMRDPNFDPDADAHTGMTASLVLQNLTGPLKVFNARILGITGDDYSGQWVGGGPVGGPQLIDFRGANIFTLHR